MYRYMCTVCVYVCIVCVEYRGRKALAHECICIVVLI